MSMEASPDAARERHRPRRGFPYRRVMIAVSGSRLPAKLIDYATASLDTESMFHRGSLAHAIVGAALEWRADLLVLGTHAGEPSDKWRFASIAEQVAQLGALPLLLVPFAMRRH